MSPDDKASLAVFLVIGQSEATGRKITESSFGAPEIGLASLDAIECFAGSTNDALESISATQVAHTHRKERGDET